MKTDVVQKVKDKFAAHSSNSPSVAIRSFYPGETVMVRNYGVGKPWVVGTVLQQTGPVSYLVKVGATG